MNTPAILTWTIWVTIGLLSAFWPWTLSGRWAGVPVVETWRRYRAARRR